MILFEKKYQTFDTVFHHQMKHLEVRQKYSAARRIFNSLLGVSSGDETLHLMFDILRDDWLARDLNLLGDSLTFGKRAYNGWLTLFLILVNNLLSHFSKKVIDIS